MRRCECDGPCLSLLRRQPSGVDSRTVDLSAGLKMPVVGKMGGGLPFSVVARLIQNVMGDLPAQFGLSKNRSLGLRVVLSNRRQRLLHGGEHENRSTDRQP